MKKRGGHRKLERPKITVSHTRCYGLTDDQIADFYAGINAIRERAMRKQPWRHVPGWNGKDQT